MFPELLGKLDAAIVALASPRGDSNSYTRLRQLKAAMDAFRLGATPQISLGAIPPVDDVIMESCKDIS